MALTKYADLAILDAQMAREGGRLMVTAHRHSFEYDPKPGFLYVRSRAISSRCNDNFDEFPASEIKAAWKSFIGRPVFVNHKNENHKRARGVIIDAALHEDVNPDGSPDTWVEVLMEVDAVRFPKLAKAIMDRSIERISMGTDVEYSVCSACGNKAHTPLEYCAHIPRMKGKWLRRHTASGTSEDVLVREICYGLRFFENSLLVEDPADPTAYFLGVDDRGLRMSSTGSLQATATFVGSTASSVRIGKRSKLAFGEEKAPAEVNTLREATCPVCGEDDTFDGEKCMVCGYIKPPDQFMDPDLDKAKEVDLRQDKDKMDPEDAEGSVDLTCDACGATVKGQMPTLPKKEGAAPRIPDKFRLEKPKDDDEDEETDEEADAKDDAELEGKGKESVPGATDDSTRTEEDIKGADDDQSREPPASAESPDAEDVGHNLPQPGDECPECGKGKLVAPEGNEGAPPEEVGGEAKPEGDPKAKQDGAPTEDAPPFESKDPKPETKPDKPEESGGKPDEAKSDEDEDDEDKKDGKDKKFPPKKSGAISPLTQKDQMMRPTLKALAEQQIQLDANTAKINAIARLAGIDLSKIDAEAKRRVAALNRQAAGEEPPVETAAHDWPVSGPSDPPFNPPSPGATAPSTSTQEAVAPEATTSVTDGSAVITDTAPDATTSLTETARRRRVAEVLPPEQPQSVDVTAPVTGTEVPPSVEEATLEEDIRTGTPADTEPLTEDPNSWPTKATSSKTIAALRLARLRIQADIADNPGDIEEAVAIEASMTDKQIEAEIATLSKVVSTASASAQRGPSRPSVPTRTRPSLAAMVNQASSSHQVVAGGGAAADLDGALLFE